MFQAILVPSIEDSRVATKRDAHEKHADVMTKQTINITSMAKYPQKIFHTTNKIVVFHWIGLELPYKEGYI